MASLFAMTVLTATAADVDVTASTNAGINLDRLSGTTVRIFPGVTVGNDAVTLMPGPTTGSYNAIFASAHPWTITNDGTLDGRSGDAISLKAGGTVFNYRTIKTQWNGVVVTAAPGAVTNAPGASIEGWSNAVRLAGGGTISNAGTMSAQGGNAIILNGGGSLTNEEGGVIETASRAAPSVYLGAGGFNTLSNRGLIRSTAVGGNATGAAIVGGQTTNYATGVIRGDYNALWTNTGSPATVTNYGRMESLLAGAIEMQQGGTVTNYGLLQGALGIDIVPGFRVTDASTAVINSGTIIGTGGTAIRFRTGTNSLTLLPTSQLTGGLVGGPGIDTFVLDGSTGTTARFDTGSNPISNFETGRKTGAGTWVLGGNGPFVPTLTLEGGRLEIDGSLSSLGVTVHRDAVIGGNGSIGSFNVLSGGIVAPGSSVGALTTSSAGFGAGSIFAVELNPAAADRLNVTGTAVIDGAATVRVDPVPAIYTAGTEYLILDAGTRVGRFGSLTDTSAFLTFVLDQDRNANQVWLRVASVTDFASVAETFNQTQTAKALQSLGPAHPLALAVAPLPAQPALRAFDQLSGEIHAGVAHALIEDSRPPREAALDRVSAAFEAIAEGNATAEFQAWVRAVGSAGIVHGDGKAADLKVQTGGLLVGADGVLDSGMVVGVEAGLTHNSLAGVDRNSTAAISGLHAGLYAGVENDGWRTKFGATYSAYGVDVTRTPTFPNFSCSNASAYGTATGQVFAEVSHVFEMDGATLEPFVRVAALHNSGGTYMESGGSSQLKGHSNSDMYALTTMGLYGSTEIALDERMNLEVKGMLGWEQAMGNRPTATHELDGSVPFTVAASSLQSGPVAKLDLGLDLENGLTLDFGLSSSASHLGATIRMTGSF